jgi:OmpA-OmpF porin, OOP family
MKNLINPIAGITVRPARCGEDAALINAAGVISVDAQGTLNRVGKDGVFEIGADGTGSAVIEGGVFEIKADGSGTIVRNDEVIEVDGKGAGQYVGRYGVIELDGKGKGSFVPKQPSKGVIEINGDGSGNWTGPMGVIEINTDGSGSWVGGPLGIVENRGDGTGTIAGKEVKMAPIPKVPPAGQFAPLDKFAPPGAPCGFVITLNDQVLFDFDKSELRPEAGQVLDALAMALKELQAGSIEIGGHTDAKGSDDYNQSLSERRAQSVAAGLRQRGSAQSATAVGYGETKPVAPNDINGQDNPGGRQLNRRVEIFVRI